MREPRRPALHVISSNARRGAEVFAVELSAALESDCRGTVVAISESQAASTLNVETLGARWNSWGTLRRLRSAMAQASVVVAHGSVTLPACVLAGLGLGVPIVYKNIGDPWFWATSLRRRLQTSVLLRRVKFIAALSPGAARAAMECWRVDPSKVVVTGGGRDPHAYHPPTAPERDAARRDLMIGPDEAVVLYLGALAPEKRPQLAVEVAEHLPEAIVLIAGDGPLRTEVEQLSVCMDGRVRVLGARSDTSTLFHASDVLLLTSASEGLPGVIIEAGLSGLPAVAADVGFVRDVTLDGVTGVIVASDDPADFAAGIRQAISDRDAMGTAARTHCLDLFDVSVARQRWLELMGRAARESV